MRRCRRRPRADNLDTDSSLPPLLILAAALLLFGWSSVVIAAARRAAPFPPLAMPDGPQAIPPAVAWLRAAAGIIAGVGAAFLAAALAANFAAQNPAGPFSAASGWTAPALIALAAVAGIAGLVILDLAARLLVSQYPAFGEWAAQPLHWRARRPSARLPHQNGASGDANGGSGSDRDSDANSELPPPPPLTAAEILNLDNTDIDMVRSISRMDDRDAAHIMVPRLDVDAVAATATLSETVAAFVASRHTRLPVYRETMDNVIGIVHISDLLLAWSGDDPAQTPESIMREPEFVAENMAVDDLLALLRRKSLQMAIVVDEFGGVEGIVTLEDVLEEIVGEITDEFTEPDGAEPAPDDNGVWTLNATMTLDDLARAAGIVLEHGEVNTVGGFVYTRLGRMPAEGDLVTADQATIEVTQMNGRRIQQVRLRVADADASDTDGNATANAAPHRKRAAK